jgi:hypothetical protein
MTELRKNFLTDAVTGRTAVLDGMSDAIQVIDYSHHETHAGSAFHVQNYGAAVAAAASIRISFATPAGTKRAHMIFSFASEGGSHMTIAEGATWDTGTGTVAVPFNQLREAAPGESVLLEDDTDTPNWTANGVLIDATADAAGTALRDVYIFGSNKVGGEGDHGAEVILMPDQTYTISLTNDEATAKDLILHLDWYEHTDKI